MTGTTHREVALASAFAISVSHLAVTQALTTPLFGITLVPLLWVPLSAFGGYFPDIDKKNTTAHRWFRKYHLLFYAFIAFSLFVLPWHLSAWFLVTFLCFELMVLKSTHRRETHSLIFHAALIGVFYFFSTLLYPIHFYLQIFIFNLLIGFVIGSLTHIIADKSNIKYVHILFPLEMIFASKDRPRFLLPNWGKIVTGTIEESAFKMKWFIFCGVITAGLGLPSLFSFIGVEIMLLSEIIVIIAVLVVFVLLWRFIPRYVRMVLAVILAAFIVWILVSAIFPNLGHLNFIRSIF